MRFSQFGSTGPIVQRLGRTEEAVMGLRFWLFVLATAALADPILHLG
jgi:hypothetical protein